MDSTINDRINAASQRRESLDAEQAATLAAELRQWEAKDDRAQELKQQNIDQKREKAHTSLDDVSAARARAEIRDAVRESTTSLYQQELDLKTALAVDRKLDAVEFIKEKQAKLQHGHAVSSDTVYAAEEEV